ncbi:MAG: Dyp-type peroxidase [Phaeodactylibacter sp.]|nr:Dyp-type peroxidase [Phaeodactylibacter sp.]MCB9303201.1 Dyp-type peroxidase [Lewinellaceae bacterium]
MDTENADVPTTIDNESPPERETRNWSLDEMLALEADDRVFEQYDIKAFRDRILKDVQADILKATKHKYTLYCFLTFKNGKKEAIAEWLSKMPLTSAFDQMEKPEENAVSLFLSYEGYEYFCDPQKIRQLVPLEDEDIIALKEGLTQRCPRAFGDNNGGTPEQNYQKTLHALILIATDKELLKANKNNLNKSDLLEIFIQETTKAGEGISFKNNFGEVFFEVGRKNPDGSKDHPREWFGFRDGISNPRFFPKPDFEKELGHKPDKPSTLSTVLRKNQLSPQPYACGSFVVFLKLKQNVEAFNEVVNALAKKLDMTDYPGYAAAYMMGRHKDGTPLHELYNFPTTDKRNLNRFDFSDDKAGAVCPMHAHIRKANPRDGQYEKRIVRRGKVYGSPSSEDKGILFLSYQSSLRTFEDIINRGLYGYNFKNQNIGKDMLFTGVGEYHGSHQYRNISGKPRSPYIRVKERLIEFMGGHYFFASSISFIRINLKNCM